MNFKNICLYILISVSSALITIFMYDHIKFSTAIEADQNYKSRLVAEHEILLTDRFDKSFRSSAPTNFIEAAKISRDAVVSIKIIGDRGNKNIKPTSGSGVIFTSDGYIATNHHVVTGASEVDVLLNDNRLFRGKVIGNDSNTDLALIKIETENLPFLVFGNSDSLQIGEWVMAVGNPFMLQSTVTAGIVSAKARNINILEHQGIESFIQTDAAVNPGNSGGALINTLGQLVGINTAILSFSGNYEGYAFAIPSNLAKKVLTDLKDYGIVQRGWMGIEILNVDQAKANQMGLKEITGVYVASVAFKSGAYDAGIRSEDIILSVNNMKTTNTSEFMELIARNRPGDEVNIEFNRQNKIQTTIVKLRNQLNTTDFVAVYKDQILNELGFEVRDLDSYEKSTIKGQGVMVVSVRKNSIIGYTKLEPGYIIQSVNKQPVKSAIDLISILSKNRGENIILEGFYKEFPGEYPYTFNIPQ